MRLLRFRMKNFCQHQHFDQEFPTGLVAIVGPNGSGKSNLLKGLIMLLTNDHRRNAGRKDANVCQQAEPDAESYLEGWLSHNNLTAHLRRSLRPAVTHSLELGDETFDSDATVTKAMEQLLAVTSNVLDEYVFVDQGGVFSFLNTGRTERARSFSKIFGLEKANELWELLGKEETSINIGNYDDLVAESSAALEKATTDVNEMTARMAQLPKDLVEQLAAARRLHDRWNEQRSIEARLAGLMKDLNCATTNVEEAEESLRLAEKSAQDSKASYEKALEDAKAAAVLLERHQNWKNKNNLDQQIIKLEAELAVLNEKPESNTGLAEQLSAAIGRSAELSREITQLDKLLTADKAERCPTCHAPAEVFAPYLQEFRERRETAVQDLALQQQRRQALELCGVRYDAWKKRFDAVTFELNIARVNQANYISAKPEDQLPEELASAMQSVVTAPEGSQIMKVRTEGQLVHCRSLLAERKTAHQQAEGRSNEAKQRLAAIAVPETETEGLLTKIETLEKHLAVQNDLYASLTAANSNRKLILENLVKHKAKQQEAKVLAAWKVDAKEMREVVHPDRLPKRAAQCRLGKINEEINNYLEAFASPYRIVIDDDFNIMAHFYDGTKSEAQRLSYAEKAIFALAFRWTVHRMFAGQLNFLALDEPTAGMDRRNLEALEPAFDRLRKMVADRGMQVLMVTHETSLAHLFDHTIRLPDPRLVAAGPQ